MEPTTEAPRVIHRIKAVHVCGLRELELIPPNLTGLFIITGPNGSGKTTALNLARMAMRGAKASPLMPIRTGESYALDQIDLGDVVVTTTWERKDGADVVRELFVERKDGSPLGATPQSFLDTIAPSTNFDVSAFLGLKPMEQAEEFRKVLGVDVSDLDMERKDLFARRTEENRDLRRAQTALQGLSNPEGPDTPVSLAELSTRLQEAIKHNADIDSMRDEHARVHAEIERLALQLAALKAKETLIAQSLAQAVRLDVDGFKIQLRDAEQTNEIVRQRKLYSIQRNQVDAALQQVHQTQTRMDEIDADRRAILESLEVPVPGLTLEDGYVAYNGIPLPQCADNEQMRAAVMLQLARWPNFRAIFVRGNEFDDDKLPVLAQLAEEFQAQIWLERRNSEEHATFILYDGSLAA